jgi:hypothetical protein
MFLRLNYLTFKQWLIINSIKLAKQFLPHNWYILFLKCVSSLSRSKLINNISFICPPSKIPRLATICFKIKNFLGLPSR